MSAVEEDEAVNLAKTVESEWRMGGLKKEVQRQLLRCHKKVGKALVRLDKGKELAEELATDPDATLEDLEKCSDIGALELDAKELQERLQKLQELEEWLGTIKGKKVVLPEVVAELALELGVNDVPPRRPARGPPKAKGPKKMASRRLPYRRYYSLDNIEIRVGKQAEDNDELSLNSKHRDGTDFWMHASGCPGSHVVIRSNGMQSLPEEVVLDAAALAARQSKASGSPVVPVSMTVCRDVVKPPGAKAGLVQLTGKVRTIKVNMKEAQKRFERLDTTVLVN